MSPAVGARRRTGAVLAAVATALAVLAGCATVPGSSDVTVLRRIGDAAEPSAPPGPMRGAEPLETVRGWVLASGATAERHEAARAFLTPQAAGRWDDGVSPTVVSDQVDTVFADRSAPGRASVRVRAARLGVLSPEGAFLARPGTVDLTVELVQTDGQWRISALPPGTLVRRSDLRVNTRQVRTWFVDPVQGTPVSDPRYLATSPVRTVVPRTLQLLLAGTSPALAGAAVSALPPGATLRSAVSTTPDGVTVVDLTALGALDDQRRLQAAQQIGLTLAGVGVTRLRLLADGAPLLPGRPEFGVEELVAGLPRTVVERGDLPVGAGGSTTSPIPGVIVAAGRVRNLDGTEQPGPAGAGEYDALSAGIAPDGQFLGVVAPRAPAGPAGSVPSGQRLLAGTVGTELTPAGVAGGVLTGPTWGAAGREVWTVVDGARVVRAELDARTRAFVPVDVDAAALTRLGPVTALRLSPDGIRVAAAVGGRVAVGAVARDGNGGARVSSVEVLRPESVDGVLDVAWTRTDRIVAVGARRDLPVVALSVDGLALDPGPTTNLTAPVTAVAAAPGRPLVAVDQSGTWTLPGDAGDAGASGEVWRSLPVGAGAEPAYPG